MNNYKGIPAKERRHVRTIVHLNAAAGEKLNPLTVYRQLLIDRDAKAKQEAQDKARIEQEDRRYRKDRARHAIEPAFIKLAELRDFLEAMEKDEGQIGSILADTCANMARLMLVEHVAKLERALFDLEVYKPENGWLATDLKA